MKFGRNDRESNKFVENQSVGGKLHGTTLCRDLDRMLPTKIVSRLTLMRSSVRLCVQSLDKKCPEFMELVFLTLEYSEETNEIYPVVSVTVSSIIKIQSTVRTRWSHICQR